MTDEAQAIALVQRTGRDALTVDQVMAQHVSGALRPLPGQGVKVRIQGTVLPYADEEAVFHRDLAAVLVQRGAAVYVV